MRTFPTIIIILVLIFLISFGSYQYIHRTTQALDPQIAKVEECISEQQWSTAQSNLNQAQEQWDKNKTWWTVLIDHQEIDKIDLSFLRLNKYLITQNLPLSLAEVSTLKLLVNHISESEKLTLENVF